MKKSYKYLAIFSAIILVAVFVPYTKWKQCKICGVQEYERGLFGIKISPFSEEEYDEYGTCSEWKQSNQKDHCDHHFVPVRNNTPMKSLDALKFYAD
jgi:hypothetical protein